MSNRHERRRERAMARGTRFYAEYTRHLPRVPLGTPLEAGRVYHTTFHHDDWCTFFDGQECNCNVAVTRHVEPERS